MKENIHVFSQSAYTDKPDILRKIGLRGRQAMEFAALELPILPGFVIDSDVASRLEEANLVPELKRQFQDIEKTAGKQFGNAENPLLVKVVVSPNLAIAHYPTLHNYGLTDETIPGFNAYVGERFGYHELQFLAKGMLEIEERIAELEQRTADVKKLRAKLGECASMLAEDLSIDERKKWIDGVASLLPEGLFSNAYEQLALALKRASRVLDLDEMNDSDAALLIQPMVYGNYGKDSASGDFYTRDIVTGEDRLQGMFYQGKFNEINAQGQEIGRIGQSHLKELQKIARAVEDHFREIRYIRFTIENKKLWLIDQRPVMTKSTQADIRTLLDLNKRKVVDEAFMVQAIEPDQLNEILHPIVDLKSVKNLTSVTGGISGAPGAAIGRVYFTTEGLLDAHKAAQQMGEDTRFILCMPATFAEDVKAIEVATGVLSSEGGYSAHASVVARQYGKVSLVLPDLKFRSNKVIIGDMTLKEGDYITVNVPHYGDPQIYFGTAELIEPDPQESGLLDYVGVVKNFVKEFHVRTNADTPRDAALALSFGAEGIGLCRTEHMFFDEKRINVFREMIISDTDKQRDRALGKLKTMQKKDFYDLFKVMDGREVTIRLLAAPLHEFLPHNNDEMNAFVEYLKESKFADSVSTREVRAKCDSLKEFNPMLGHRGCRIAVSYPEIYAMQMSAIFEAVYQLQSEGGQVHPEIMIPLIMNSDELKLIVYGKRIEGKSYKGLVEIEEGVRAALEAKAVPYKIGTMIELPVAALGSGEIAKYAEFFSFGTNDLTQTTIGLSRDDFNSFMPDYTQFDILEGNPFSKLNQHVKELIEVAVRRGTMTRPGLVKGLCGEHGANPENIKFCMDVGMQYVSCSPYSVPIANLAVAQLSLETAAE